MVTNRWETQREGSRKEHAEWKEERSWSILLLPWQGCFQQYWEWELPSCPDHVLDVLSLHALLLCMPCAPCFSPSLLWDLPMNKHRIFTPSPMLLWPSYLMKDTRSRIRNYLDMQQYDKEQHIPFFRTQGVQNTTCQPQAKQTNFCLLSWSLLHSSSRSGFSPFFRAQMTYTLLMWIS